MLVLSRLVGEKIRIGKDVVISINRVAGGKVTVGIEAPREVPVMRTEIEDRPPRRKLVA